jgi:hypothetical protein
MNKLWLFLFLFLVKFYSFTQFRFNFQDSIQVFRSSSEFSKPWSGGLNNAQFSDIDYDFDGDLDLFVFDRSNNQLRLFVQENIGSQKYYRLDPMANLNFPSDLRYRATCVDYNGDGKNDIFTYGIGGLKVYKNTGNAISGLQWDLASNLLYSDIWGTKMNLYVSSGDIPAIVDVDYDGDIDVLTYHISGEYLQFHQNQSKELYNHSDSLIFVLKNECWGGFREDVNTNTVFLNDTTSACNSGNVPNPLRIQQSGTKAHAGSTVLAFDIDGSGVKDLILGDVAYPSLNLLINGGTAPNTDSKMISQDASFPANSTPVNMQLFPAAFWVDVDFDGINDLIVSPNAKNVSENESSCIKYKNTGSNNVSNFIFETKSFLQQDMIEHGTGSIPVLTDITGDGLVDLFVGNFYSYKPTLLKESKLAYYKNTGTATNPKFTFIDDDFMNLSQANYGLRIVPTFGDLDNDGKKDMILGLENGTLVYYKNNGTTSNPSYNIPTVNYTDNTGTAINVGQYAAPQLYDLNKDNKLDIIIGEKTGKLVYYENVGTTNVPQFQLASNNLGGIDIVTSSPDGYPIPHFFNQSDTTYLLIGTGEGGVQFYNQIDNNLSGSFNQINNDFLGLKTIIGAYSACAVAELDNDNKLNLIVGQDLGGLFHLEHDPNSNLNLEEVNQGPKIKFYPNPTKDYLIIETESWPLNLKLYDFHGQELTSVILNSEKTTLDIQRLSTGIYFMKNETNSQVFKLIKE